MAASRADGSASQWFCRLFPSDTKKWAGAVQWLAESIGPSSPSNQSFLYLRYMNNTLPMF
ncbi:hypothetical protein F3Y22_tig00000002pilonHSYRG00077 [Hibiscus syriacus]|uniref:Uncharacterized protein n=1 Tax=Hibiscus syriacus TaxID=106335 RepID=A0A6A3D3Z2_HIBSY|nr:hypothetical protein F3Y22_tig00000002pilonHSYRG00077 [Hibiscus syriacus]